jgi:hypothetical protein
MLWRRIQTYGFSGRARKDTLGVVQSPGGELGPIKFVLHIYDHEFLYFDTRTETGVERCS